VRLVDPNPCGVLIFIEDAAPPGTQVDTSTVQLTFDGNPVSASAIKSGTTTTVAYKVANPLAANSSHSISLTFKDNGTPAASQKFDRNFTIPNYPTIPASYALASPATTPGLKAQIYQIDFVRIPPDENSIVDAEQQWARGYLNPANGQPFPNVAASSSVIDVDYINWNGAVEPSWPGTDVGTEIGNFQSTNSPPQNIADVPIPAIPGTGSDPRGGGNNGLAVDNIVAEVETYLQLNPGCYRMGVNSDDGFKVTVAPGAPDPFGLLLGSYNGGRGSSDTTFDFVVTTAGYYPFRLLWWQGVGGANLEWFTVDLSTGNKILVNQADPNAVKAFRTGQDKAHVKSIVPANGYAGVETNSPVKIVLEDGSTTVVDGSISLWIDGNQVSPTINNGATTTVTYNGSYKYVSSHTGILVWGESTSPQTMHTNNFTYSVRQQTPDDLRSYTAGSICIEAEDFDATRTPLPDVVNTMP